MELHLQKYRYAHNEYLVYDCSREPFIVENEEVRIMCSANFGIDVKNMLVGPIVHKDELTMLLYHPDGTVGEADEDSVYVFNRYLSDAGYIKKYQKSEAVQVSRIYLYDHFIMDNGIKLIEEKDALSYHIG